MKKILVLLPIFFLAAVGCNPNQIAEKEKCQEIGQKYRKDTLEEFSKMVILPRAIDGYEITFNKKKNTCLYFAQISESGRPREVYILDLLTNKRLYSALGTDVNILDNHKDFYEKKDQLFGN